MTTSSTSKRAGLIGCGAIAENHLAGYRKAGVDVVLVCDVDLQRAREFASHGIAVATSDIDTALGWRDVQGQGLDLVSVCTPHPTHPQIVIAAAAAGLHVICEKPISIDLDAAQAMVDACEQAGVLLSVCFQRRFWPASLAIRSAIDDGRLGTPMIGDCQVLLHRRPEYYAATPWRGRWDTDGGGVLMTQAIHYLDLLQWFMGPVVEVTGRISTIKHGEHIEVEDTAVALLRFGSGGFATVRATTAAGPALGASVTVTGQRGGTVRVTEFPEGTPGVNDVWQVDGQTHYRPAHVDGVNADVELSQINAALVPYHAALIADVVDAIDVGRQPIITGRDAVAALQIVLAVYQSHGTNAPVRLRGSLAQAGNHLQETR